MVAIGVTWFEWIDVNKLEWWLGGNLKASIEKGKKLLRGGNGLWLEQMC